jgi:hypothetical protein
MSLLLGILASCFLKGREQLSTWSAKTTGHLGLTAAEQVRRRANSQTVGLPWPTQYDTIEVLETKTVMNFVNNSDGQEDTAQ